MAEITQVLSSLSFDEYVLIDCLKYNQKFNLVRYITAKSYSTRLHEICFVALTKQGFINVLNEIMNNITMSERNYCLCLFDNQIQIHEGKFVFIIKYTIKDIKELVNLPGLDFFKCYYDGNKMYCTSEAIQCHKTDKVQYTGKINLDPSVVRKMFECKTLRFKKELWETNKEYTVLSKNSFKFNHDLDSDEFLNQNFPTKYDVKKRKELFGTKQMFTIDYILKSIC
jgi:hypothetical protein